MAQYAAAQLLEKMRFRDKDAISLRSVVSSDIIIRSALFYFSIYIIIKFQNIARSMAGSSALNKVAQAILGEKLNNTTGWYLLHCLFVLTFHGDVKY